MASFRQKKNHLRQFKYARVYLAETRCKANSLLCVIQRKLNSIKVDATYTVKLLKKQPDLK